MSPGPMSNENDPIADLDGAEILPPGGTVAGSGRERESEADATMREAAARIEALETELAEVRDHWVRSEAEMQNLRARAKRDVDDARQFAVQKFASDVVEAAENLKRGLASLPPPSPDESPVVGKLREGFEGVQRSFVALLERNGIVGADPTGQRFDANLHQAMAEQEAEAPSGTVVAAWTSAWTLHGRLLKPAMVVVSKGPAAGAAPLEPSSPGSAGSGSSGDGLDTVA